MADPTEALLQQMQDQIAQLQLDLQASTATATAATAAAAVATTALAAMPPAGAPATLAPRFALLPAMANAGAFLDLSYPQRVPNCSRWALSLCPGHSTLRTPQSFRSSWISWKTKAKVQGWSRIFTVPVDVQGVVTSQSLLQNYGGIPLPSVYLDATSYVNTPTKAAQDSFMLFQCIFASLGTEFLKTVTTEAPNYHVADQNGTNEPPIPCGALLLKVIIMKAHVDTRATVSFIRTALSSLDNKMMALDSDILKFNAYVKTQVIALEARGETTTDLLVNVFKGYESAQDADFIDFVKRKKDAYDEGDNITVTNLMDAAENKYKTRVLLKTWSAPTKEQEQILALTAQVNRLRLTPKKTDPLLPRRDISKAKQDREKKWAWKKVCALL